MFSGQRPRLRSTLEDGLRSPVAIEFKLGSESRILDSFLIQVKSDTEESHSASSFNQTQESRSQKLKKKKSKILQGNSSQTLIDNFLEGKSKRREIIEGKSSSKIRSVPTVYHRLTKLIISLVSLRTRWHCFSNGFLLVATENVCCSFCLVRAWNSIKNNEMMWNMMWTMMLAIFSFSLIFLLIFTTSSRMCDRSCVDFTDKIWKSWLLVDTARELEASTWSRWSYLTYFLAQPFRPLAFELSTPLVQCQLWMGEISSLDLFFFHHY